jgi:hypothetical protein
MKLLKSHTLASFGVLIFLCIPVLLPLFHSGFFVTDDAEWMIIRLSAFYQALSDGQFPVRFLGRLNHEYGYPVATFLYPAFLYLGSIIHLFKIGFVTTLKIILGLSILSSATFTFFWFSRLFTRKAAIVGALIFVYSPYYLFDLYGRGSVGEVLAFAIVPFIFWQLERGSRFWSTLGIAALILSHNSLAVLFLPLVILYMAYHVFIAKERKAVVYKYTQIIILGISIASFFWLPVLFELPHTIFSTTNISDWSGYFAAGELVGYTTLVIFVSTVALYFFKKNAAKKHRLPFIFLLSGTLSLFMATEISAPLWNILPAGFIQFPFRFLSVLIVCSAFLAGFVISNIRGIYQYALISLAAFFLATAAYGTLSGITYIDKGEGFYTTNSATTTVHDEYMPKWVKEKPTERPSEKVEIVKGEGEIRELSVDNKKILFGVDVRKTDTLVRVNTIFWPGWTATINGEKTAIAYNNKNGVMEVKLQPGIWQVGLFFGESSMRLVSDIISVTGIIILFFLTFKKGEKLKKTHV